MKNIFNVLLVRTFGIIALVAVIGFSMAACGDLNVPVSGVTLNKSSISLAVGGTETLTATVSPSDATNKDVGWSSSNTNVATVTYGTVTAVSAGSATITVTTADGGKTATCSVTVTGGSSSLQPIDGVWQRPNGTQVTVSGSTGVLTVITSYPDTITQSAIDKGYISVGSQYWRNITSTGTLTWSGQGITVQYYTSNPNVAIGSTWTNRTFTMSADGQTLTVDGSDTWTRVTTYSLDGVWQRPNGTQVTISGSTGVLTVITSYPDTITQSAIDKGYISVGSQYWRNITRTGTLTWSGQGITVQYYTSNPNVAIGSTWTNRTFTMSADGQTLTIDDSDTWTRM